MQLYAVKQSVHSQQLQFISGGYSHSKREMLLAQISLAIVAVFILCHTVKWIPNLWELRQAEIGKVATISSWPV